MTGAHEVLAMLRRHYLPENRPAGVLWMPEIASPCGRRRADLLIAPTSLSHQAAGALVGHEIKVTRSDVLAELADPTKPDPWMRYCTRWWLVVADPALIEGLTIPDAWGVMGPPSGRRTRSMTVLRDAPRLTPTGDMSPALTRVAQFIVGRMETETARLERDVRLEREAKDRALSEVDRLRTEREYGQELSSLAARKQVERIRRIIRLVEGQKYAHGVPWFDSDVSDEVIADAILDHARTRAVAQRARRDVERLIEDVRARTTPLGSVADDLTSLDLDAVVPPEAKQRARKR